MQKPTLKLGRILSKNTNTKRNSSVFTVSITSNCHNKTELKDTLECVRGFLGDQVNCWDFIKVDME